VTNPIIIVDVYPAGEISYIQKRLAPPGRVCICADASHLILDGHLTGSHSYGIVGGVESVVVQELRKGVLNRKVPHQVPRADNIDRAKESPRLFSAGRIKQSSGPFSSLGLLT
jgi:hypothetical protein